MPILIFFLNNFCYLLIFFYSNELTHNSNLWADKVYLFDIQKKNYLSFIILYIKKKFYLYLFYSNLFSFSDTFLYKYIKFF